MPGVAPGGNPARYYPHGQPPGYAPGSLGQQIHYDNPLDFIATYDEAVEIVGQMIGILPTFGWQVGNENAPSHWLGAANAIDRLALVGNPLAGFTPWQDRHGNAIASEVYDAVAYRAQVATSLDPADGDDAVMMALVRTPAACVGSRIYLGTATNTATRGLMLYQNGVNAGLYVVGNAGAGSATAVGYGLLTFLLGIVNRDGNIVCLINGTPCATPATPAGALGTDQGIGLSASPIGVGPIASSVVWASYYYGTGIADPFIAGTYAFARRLTNAALGIYPRCVLNLAATTLTRATVAGGQDRNGRHHFFSAGMPRAGEAPGMRVEAQRINRVYRTAGVPLGALAEWIADDASTGTGVADAAALAAALASTWGPNVVSYANATGATRYIRCGAATGAVTRFALSVYARIVAGAGARIGWWDTAGPGWTDVGAITDGYATRTVFENLVPPAATCVFCIAVPNGCTLYWFAAQSEGNGSGTTCPATTAIPNWAAAATAQRNWEDFLTPYDPIDGEGGIEFVVTPPFSGAASGGVAILYLSGGGLASFDVNGGTWRAELLDGTTTIDSGVAPVAGTAHRIQIMWASSGVMALVVRNDATDAVLARVQAAYDGTLRYAGTWEFISGDAGYHLRGVRALKRFAG